MSAAAFGSGDEGADFDDFPETHLDDDAYEAWAASEVGADGRVREGDPPVARVVILLVLVIALVAVALLL
jgi:hypothetical protein